MEVRHFGCTIAGLGAKRDVNAHTCLKAGNLKNGSTSFPGSTPLVGCSSRTLIVSLFKMKAFSRNRSSEFRRKNLPNIQHCHICSDHFELSCFEGLLATAVDAILKGLGHAILGNFSIDQMVIELTEITK